MRHPSDNPIWEAHLQWLRQMYGHGQRPAGQAKRRRTSIGDCEAETARRSEWAARPLGRLGRLLHAELEPYLEFFAIARA